MFVLFFFFFKQKTAYEMRISDWSSDVCSSDLDELNGWLEAECRRWAERQAHPEQGELTVAQALEIERSALQPMLGPFDGFNESEHAVTGTCLISFDRNRYSVLSTMARRTVQVRAYATRIVVRCGEEVVAEHARTFGRNRTIYDPWHYLPVLARKDRKSHV